MATIIGNLKGAIGAQGATGVTGSQGVIGVTGAAGAKGASSLMDNGVPANTLGLDGDYYTNLLTGDVYKKTAGVW